MKTGQRAYVFVPPARRIKNLVEADRYTAEIILKNFGLTPAHDVEFWAGIIVRDRNSKEPFKPAPLNPGKFVLSPNAEISYPLPIGGQKSAAEEEAAIGKGDKALYIWGEIKYLDAFDVHHIATFRMLSFGYYSIAGTFNYDLEGNSTN